MPSRNVIKPSVKEAHFHLYNRGVAKQDIFLDRQDYIYFLNSIAKILTPDLTDINSLFSQIAILSFILMPNHFHILFQQKDMYLMTKFMKKLATGYAMYFNQKYKRVGPVFQGVYKASFIDSDEYLIHLSRYIDTNCLDLKEWDIDNLKDYEFSSYSSYVGEKRYDWLQTEQILRMFSEDVVRAKELYREFVEDYIKEDLSLGKYVFDE